MKIVYVTGPISDSRGPWFEEQNVRRAEVVAAELWKLGFSVICPHSNTRNYGGLVPYEQFIRADLEIVSRCDFLVACEGWDRSKGALTEIYYAANRDIPVYVWDDPEGRLGVYKEREGESGDSVQPHGDSNGTSPRSHRADVGPGVGDGGSVRETVLCGAD